jgi:hypothetical protein
VPAWPPLFPWHILGAARHAKDRTVTQFYQVTLTGQRISARPEEELVANFMTRFGVDETKARSLLTGRRLLKDQLDQKTAAKLAFILMRMGLEAVVEEMAPAPAKVAPTPVKKAVTPAPAAPAASIAGTAALATASAGKAVALDDELPVFLPFLDDPENYYY